MPADADQLGICFGGTVLSWIDVAAGLAAKTLARGPVVTASVDAVHFLRPARAGSVAVVAATVNRVFASSAEVGGGAGAGRGLQGCALCRRATPPPSPP